MAPKQSSSTAIHSGFVTDLSALRSSNITWNTHLLRCIGTVGLTSLLNSKPTMNENAVRSFYSSVVVLDDALQCSMEDRVVRITPETLRSVFDFPQRYSEAPTETKDQMLSFLQYQAPPKKGRGIQTVGFQGMILCLANIIGQSVLCKRSAFDAVNSSQLQYLYCVVKGITLDWGTIIFNLIKDQMTHRGFGIILSRILEHLNIGQPQDFIRIPSTYVIKKFFEGGKVSAKKQLSIATTEGSADTFSSVRPISPQATEASQRQEETHVTISPDELTPVLSVEMEEDLFFSYAKAHTSESEQRQMWIARGRSLINKPDLIAWGKSQGLLPADNVREEPEHVEIASEPSSEGIDTTEGEANQDKSPPAQGEKDTQSTVPDQLPSPTETSGGPTAEVPEPPPTNPESSSPNLKKIEEITSALLTQLVQRQQLEQPYQPSEELCAVSKHMSEFKDSMKENLSTTSDIFKDFQQNLSNWQSNMTSHLSAFETVQNLTMKTLEESLSSMLMDMTTSLSKELSSIHTRDRV